MLKSHTVPYSRLQPMEIRLISLALWVHICTRMGTHRCTQG